MRYGEAIKALKSRKEKKFSLVGEEPYLKEQFITASKVFFPDSEFSLFYHDQEDELLNYLYSPGLFGERVIVVRSTNRMGFDRVLPVIEGSDDIVVLSMMETSKLSKSATQAVGATCKVECQKMKEYGPEYSLWISSKIRGAGYTADDGVDDLVYKQVGPSMTTIANELKKLFLYKSDDKHITGDDVTQVISRTAANTSYSILENLLRSDLKAVFQAFDTYRRSNDNVSDLVFFLAHYFEKIYRMVLMRDAGMSVDSIADVLKMPKFFITQKYLPRAISLGRLGLERYMYLVRDLDQRLRGFRGDQTILIDHFIAKFSV